MNNNELVSVIIPTYNRSKTIVNSVNSVLKQSYSNIEVIIVDDGSTDNTKDIIKSIHDDRVIYIYQENNGACYARNTGIKCARGKFIAFHDSDDIWHTDKLQKQMKCFSDKDIDIVICKLNCISKDGVIQLPTHLKNGLIKPVKNLSEIGTQSIVARSDVFKEFQFDPSFPRYQDMDFLYRASKKCLIYCIDEGLVDYYIGDDSISASPEKKLRACKLFLEKHPDIKLQKGTSYFLARSLINESYELKKNNLEYSEYINTALKLSASVRILIKIIQVFLGLNPVNRFHIKK